MNIDYRTSLQTHVGSFIRNESTGPFLFTLLTSLIENRNFLTDVIPEDVFTSMSSAFSIDYMKISMNGMTIPVFCTELSKQSIQLGFIFSVECFQLNFPFFFLLIFMHRLVLSFHFFSVFFNCC